MKNEKIIINHSTFVTKQDKKKKQVFVDKKFYMKANVILHILELAALSAEWPDP